MLAVCNRLKTVETSRQIKDILVKFKWNFYLKLKTVFNYLKDWYDNVNMVMVAKYKQCAITNQQNHF